MEVIRKENFRDNYKNLARGYRTHLSIKKPVKRYLYFVLGVFFILITIPYVFFVITGKESLHWIFISLFLGIYYLYFHFFSIEKFYKKKARWVYNLEINAEGINEQGSEDNNWVSNQKWDFYTETFFKDDMILHYQKDDLFKMLFASDFSNEEFNQIKEWIKAKVKVEYKN